MSARLNEGAVVKKTALTPEFDASAFAKTHPDAVPLLLLAPANNLIVLTGDLAMEGAPGMTIVSLAQPTRNVPETPVASPETLKDIS